ncbi:HFR050Wp [Eremothecium sinecaudum]|uniref:HFR050Wp n=1 Tax=Eremothecium sinecaudum TaxID=45286 RepID=A0A0X8HV09_9SACH|nr:HFR050Wp [Eremothecium sinecaudum]AMD21905.1 HFR050Wp [Eremothecium sinecaudum]
MTELSARDYISQQEALEQEARELMPWDPTTCTYSMGALRQPIFACRTCGNIGVCYSCSIQCHTECDLVELFEKRNFSCDCGTERQVSELKTCQLRKNTTPDIPDYSNRYGQNFRGLFCSCHSEYDPSSSMVMVQCLLGLECNEDWYHDYCVLGCSENPSGERTNGTLAGFPALDTFGSFICWKCVSKYQAQFERILCHERSTELVAHIVKHVASSTIKDREEILTKKSSGAKRKRDDDFPFCIFLKEGHINVLKSIKQSLEEGDKLFTFLADIAPFLVNEESSYEPPEDTDPVTTYEAASRVLNTVDNEIVMNGALAYHAIKSKLSDFLKPFAETGRIVKEEDIKSFFEAQNKTT